MSKSKFTFEEISSAANKYFHGNGLAADVWAKKYALKDRDGFYDELTPTDMHHRLASEFARIEKKYENPMSEDEIFSLFDQFQYIIPQGSPMFGVGNKYQVISQSNCFAIATIDSYGGICRTDERIAQISKRRGGVGIDVSPIRPKGLPTHNAAQTTDGIVVFMQRFSNTTKEVAQHGRRGALMLSCSVHHPEILSFIKSKAELAAITGANISVRLTDEFMNAVKEERDFELRWPVDSKNPTIRTMIPAKEIWDEIVKHAFMNAEPGVLFWDNITKNSPADCYIKEGFETVTTNPSLRWDTRVMTDHGMLPIKVIAESYPNCKVVNIRGEWKDAKVFMSGQNKQLYKIKFTNGQEVFCTPEHKWPLLNTLNGAIDKRNQKIIKKETKTLSKRDKIYLPTFENVVGNSSCVFTRLDGFVIGWNQGDGCISKTQKGQSQYSFIFGEEDLNSGIGELILNYSNSIAKNASTLNQDHDAKCFGFCTSDKFMDEKLNTLGVCNKKDGVPETIWNGNIEFIKGYIDGLFSSDGSVDVGTRTSRCGITFTTAHKKLAYDVRKLLSFFGIRSLVSYAKCKSHFPKYNSDKEYERYDLHIDGIGIAKFSKIFSLTNVKKQKRIEEIIELIEKTGNNTKNGRKEYSNDRPYLVVKTVEKTDFFEDVYDITVQDDTHTFLMECGITGNCSELPLAEGSSCILMLLNLASYVDNPFTPEAKFDFDKYAVHVQKAMRLLDDLVDLEIESVEKIIEKIQSDPEPDEVKENELSLWNMVRDKCINGRRTGLGITALGDAIAMMNYKYGDESSFGMVEKIYAYLRNEAYRESVLLAKQRGKFPIHNCKNETNHAFLSKLPVDILSDMEKYGRRHIACLTTAPAGSVSNLSRCAEGRFGTSSGFEPVFMASYTRKKKMSPNETKEPDSVGVDGERFEHFHVQHPGLQLFCDVTGKTFEDSPYFGSQANEINYKDRVLLQGMATGYVDHAISSTVNLPQDIGMETVADIYMQAWQSGCKGITVYREGSRDGILVSSVKSNLPSNCENCDDAAEKFKTLVRQGGRPQRVILSSAPKRPNDLECDIVRTTVKGQQWVFLVGKLNGQPYEIFGGANDDLEIPKKFKTGWIQKDGINAGRSMYDLILGSLENDGKGTRLVINNIASVFGSYGHATFSRVVSLSLRHGIPIKFTCEQLVKDPEDDFQSYNRALARVLKSYIEEGEQSGLECPNCHAAKMVYKGGCPSCMVCGTSSCS